MTSTVANATVSAMPTITMIISTIMVRAKTPMSLVLSY